MMNPGFILSELSTSSYPPQHHFLPHSSSMSPLTQTRISQGCGKKRHYVQRVRQKAGLYPYFEKHIHIAVSQHLYRYLDPNKAMQCNIPLRQFSNVCCFGGRHLCYLLPYHRQLLQMRTYFPNRRHSLPV